MTPRARGWLVASVVVVLTGATAVAIGVVAGRAGSSAPPPPTASSSSSTSPTPTPTPTPSPSPTPSPTPTVAPPPDVLAGWSLEQKVGQLFMVGVDLTKPQQSAYDAVRRDHVGNVFLHGRTTGGVDAARDLVSSMTSLVSAETTHGTRMLVATDQEGGQVQVLRGPGFDAIPAATTQATWPAATLQARAATWGAQLAAAGVNLDLAPVMDLVPAGTEASNPPVGALQRNYGTSPATVTAGADAFARGLEASGVDVAIKHFPGLGRVTANTDTTAGVTDTVTGRGDSSVAVFRSGIGAGARLVMVSTAVYSRIDGSRPAAFSPVVVTEVLRGDLGFGGVVITDDVSAAKQVLAWSAGDRAVLAIDAGVDIVLMSTDPSQVHAAVAAVVSRAQQDPGFAAKVDAAARRVLAAKASLR